MKRRRKKKKVILSLFKPPSRVYIAGFPIAKNAFYNQLWDWKTLENILVK